MPGWLVDAMLEMHWVCKAGHAAAPTTAVREVLGCEPRSFAQFAADHAAAWKLSD